MKTKLFRIALISFLFLQSFISFSQTFYELQFHDNTGIPYLGFMVYYGENNCYLRVAFSQGDVYNVVNVEYESKTGNENGTNYQLLVGKNPTYITENPTQLGYNPEHFIWFWNDSISSEIPFFTDDPDFKPENIREVDNFSELHLDQLSEEYLHQFYNADEPDYLSFVNALNNQNSQADQDHQYNQYYQNDQNNQINQNNHINQNDQNINTTRPDTALAKPVLHLIIAANTSISNIGLSCTIDMKNFKSDFEGIAEALGINIQEYFVSDNSFSKQNVLDEIAKVNPAANDIVIFLYSGHGIRYDNQTDSYPQLDLRLNSFQDLNDATSLSLSTVYSSLVSKGARLTLVLSNCCNSKLGINQVTSSSFLSTMSNQNYNKSNLAKLILNSSGSLIATAASPGEYAWCNDSNGSYFVNGFLQSFYQEISFLNTKTPDWDGILTNAIASAKSATSPASCPSCKVQNGLMSSKISK